MMRPTFYFVCAKTAVGPLYLRDGKYQGFISSMTRYPTEAAATGAMRDHPHYAAEVWTSESIL